ncbi:glycosyl hydrolase family 16 [Mucilaginibacter oryzae]|uniref:Glycosyl hydrolase family 16 n=1 Tax=Mucilaginibacter oryzae TaxID=468058 RepID=A0A316HCL8_9SPHI|nr:glycoside hydrolase family 16 protein [Mucilaginibacter oryzae]PWK77730.1 glycosyl hydrolase family 16 [Mucilaginibacter oryzae]
MKNRVFVLAKLIFIVVFLPWLNIASAQTKRGMKLVWHDEFDYNGLPDSNKWTYEDGFIRDGEKEFYTKNRVENAKVGNGLLTITARKEEFVNYNYAYYKGLMSKERYFSELIKYPKQFRGKAADSIPAWVRNRYDSLAHYTSASLVTRGKASWKYGRVEIRAKLPRGKGVVPAAWMLGTSFSKETPWPQCGEIDIMEFVGRVPGQIYGHVHYKDPATNRHVHYGSAYKLPLSGSQWHVYAVEWNSKTISFFCDDKLYYTFMVSEAGPAETNPYNKPFYLLLNMSLGGAFGGMVDDTIFPQQYQIDYVRIYQ